MADGLSSVTPPQQRSGGTGGLCSRLTVLYAHTLRGKPLLVQVCLQLRSDKHLLAPRIKVRWAAAKAKSELSPPRWASWSYVTNYFYSYFSPPPPRQHIAHTAQSCFTRDVEQIFQGDVWAKMAKIAERFPGQESSMPIGGSACPILSHNQYMYYTIPVYVQVSQGCVGGCLHGISKSPSICKNPISKIQGTTCRSPSDRHPTASPSHPFSATKPMSCATRHRYDIDTTLTRLPSIILHILFLGLCLEPCRGAIL